MLSPRPAAEWQRAETELEGGEASVTLVCSARLMLAALGSAPSFLQCSMSLTPYECDDKVCLALLMLAAAGSGAPTAPLGKTVCNPAGMTIQSRGSASLGIATVMNSVPVA